MKETVEIVPAGNGSFVARLTFGEAAQVDMPLPPGFEKWSDDEQRAHMKRFVVPRFKALVARARAGQKLYPQDGELIVQNPTDQARLERAQAKRERKARKLMALN